MAEQLLEARASFPVIRVLPRFLYLEPTSVCNLRCRMCYTNVINGKDRRVVDPVRVLDFVRRFAAATEPPISIYWCGTGEVFMHPQFPEMVNTVLSELGSAASQTIQTNGTLGDRLRELSSLSAIDFRVSIDGRRPAHEWLRGDNTYERAIRFCREAVDRGCRSLTVRTLLTRQNVEDLDAFHEELVERLGARVQLLLGIGLSKRSMRRLRQRSLAVVQNELDHSYLLSESEARQIVRERYQDRYVIDEHTDPSVMDNYLSLTTYGVHSCCHGAVKLGEAESDIAALRQSMADSDAACRACSACLTRALLFCD